MASAASALVITIDALQQVTMMVREVRDWSVVGTFEVRQGGNYDWSVGRDARP
jgi:hypothetical protein